MNDLKRTGYIALTAFAISTFLGYLDYETESLLQLFSRVDNLLALFIYTMFFTAIAWICILVFRMGGKLVTKL
jgi:hypothetical protein